MRKEDIHINLLKEILIEAGYTKEQTNLVDYETIVISDDTLYVLLEIDGDGFAINIDTYMNYHNWWTSIERDTKINDIFNDN